MKDIYNRLATDLTYVPACETDDEIEIILLQIKMILGTTPGQVLGSPYFGVNIKKYLFNLSYDKEEITEVVKMAILPNIKYDTAKYDVGISLDFGKDYVNKFDYAVINISINLKNCLGIIINQ